MQGSPKWIKTYIKVTYCRFLFSQTDVEDHRQVVFCQFDQELTGPVQ